MDQIACAIYCRFSSKNQEGGFSIEAQQSACTEFANKQGWTIHKIFIDRAQTGTSDDRDSFQEIMGLAAQDPPQFQVILVHKLDRFARNRYDSIKYKYFLRKRGIRVISVTQPIVGSNDPTEILVESLLEGIDEYYSANLGRESIKGMVENLKAGFWNGARPPFGYKTIKVNKDGRDHSKLEINPLESPIIEYIFGRYSKGSIGIKALTMDLNSRKGWKPRSQKYFSVNWVERILKNEKYAGDVTYGKTLNKNNRTIQALPAPITVKNTHPAIIAKDIFERVQLILQSRAPENAHPRIHNDSYLLSGLIFCPKCGARYQGAAAKSSKFHYYTCGTKRRKGKDICPSPDYNRDWIERQVVQTLKEKIVTRENIQNLALKLFKIMKDSSPDLISKIRRVNTEIESKQGKLKKLYEVLESSNDLNVDDLAPRIRELNSEISSLKIQIIALNEQLERNKKAKLNQEWLDNYSQMLVDILDSDSFYARKNFVRRLIDRIEINNKKCEITYRPFNEDLVYFSDPPSKKEPGPLIEPEFSQKNKTGT